MLAKQKKWQVITGQHLLLAALVILVFKCNSKKTEKAVPNLPVVEL